MRFARTGCWGGDGHQGVTRDKVRLVAGDTRSSCGILAKIVLTVTPIIVVYQCGECILVSHLAMRDSSGILR